MRKFIGLNGNTIALQNKFYNSTGNVPFWAMPKLLNQTGNSFMFRGLPDGRYRDKGAFAFQGEYRHSFKNRFGFVIFASTGSVFSSWSDIGFSEFFGYMQLAPRKTSLWQFISFALFIMFKAIIEFWYKKSRGYFEFICIPPTSADVIIIVSGLFFLSHFVVSY